MGSRLLRSIGRGYSHSQRRFLYPCSAATHYSLLKFALSSSSSPASWEPKPLFTSPANIRFFTASPGSSKIVVVNSDSEFSNLLSKAQEDKGLAVAYFTAVWCGPCRTIAPLVDNLSTSYPNVTFMKLDIDQENLSNTLRNSGVSSVFLKSL
ncbi:thioredoxin O2, mitochondrial isoform X2 [Cryptomeria japonica]|uniref:thioredoxin O2, mitochondrial isoform X2 n=1 Tax=Cryptomeria japonica TaxID=3369 RepID=UPI0027DA580D|nr:thioredoxin O2, mitochondrial isoform X2 [Cryptomeria japonica]